jgi:2,4-diketo-3-deoxy-L-fuconate hydrolase
VSPELLLPFSLAATIAIAPLDEALTFARIEGSDGPRVLLVRSYVEGELEAVDLSDAVGHRVRDPITAFHDLGYGELARIAASAAPETLARVAASELTIPVALGSHHVAAGTNYPEHAGEAGVEDGPFLFAKLVEPTASTASVAAGAALLDYEVELAWVTLTDVRDGSPPAEMGVILCNDFTDRETLLRHLDVADVASGKGFTTGKSAPGYLPVGDLFVIPHDYRAFSAARELRLEVNGEIRQRAPVSAHVWNVDRIFAEIWKRRDVRWDHRGEHVALLADGHVLPARSLVMAGTPAGTVFRGIGMRHRATGVASWILRGFDRPVAESVIESYVGDPAVRSRYLRPGDRVTIEVDYLGTIHNHIVP